MDDIDISDIDIAFDGETGATAIEYALIASLLSIVILAAVIAVGASVTDLFQRVVDAWPS